MFKRLLRRNQAEKEQKEREQQDKERKEEVERIKQGLHDAASRVHYIEVTKQVLRREAEQREKEGH